MLARCENISEGFSDETTRSNLLDIADELYRTISYKEAAVLVSSQIYENHGIKFGYLPSRGNKIEDKNTVFLRSSDRAIEVYDRICKENNVERLKAPVSTQLIRKLHLLAFGEEFVKKAKQRDGSYLPLVVKLDSPIRVYKSLYKETTQDVPVQFSEISTDIDVEETHEKDKFGLSETDLCLVTENHENFCYPKYDIFLQDIKIGTVFKIFYYVYDKNNRVRKKTSLFADIAINIDGRVVTLKSPNKKVITNIREWLVAKLRNCLKNMIQTTIEYQSDNRGIIFAAMPMITKMAQMNNLLAQSPAGRDSDLVNWIERQELDPDGIPYFPNRELLSNLIIN